MLFVGDGIKCHALFDNIGLKAMWENVGDVNNMKAYITKIRLPIECALQ
jgi:hypothetical protein